MNEKSSQLPTNPNDFTMVTRGYWAAIRQLAKTSAPAFQIFTLLTERMSRTNAVVISQKALCQILGYSRTTVSNSIKLLEEGRWLQVVKIGSSNGYVVNAKVVWRTHTGKRYASFYAEVIAAESEQDRTAEDWEGVELRNVPIIRKGESLIDDGAALPPPDQTDLFAPQPEELGNGVGFLPDDTMRPKTNTL